MIKTLRVMLVLNKYQNTRLFQFAGTSRFAYNWALEQEKKNYEAGGKFINDYELRKRFTASAPTGSGLRNVSGYLRTLNIPIHMSRLTDLTGF